MEPTNPTPGQPGTPATGTAPQTPATGDVPQYVERKDIDGIASQIRKINEAIGKLPNPLEALAELGLLEKTSDGKFAVKAPAAPAPAGTPKPKTEDDDSPLAKEVKTLRQQMQDKDNQIEEQKKQSAAQARDRAVIDAMKDAGAYKAERDFVHFREKVVLNEQGQYVVKSKDQYGNDVDQPLKDFIGASVKDNPELFKNASQPGSGTPSGSQAIPAGSRVIPKSTWSETSFYMANKAKFDSGEFIRGN